MIERIKEILSGLDADHWKIIENKRESKELFFIKKELDMNRGKKVYAYDITLYKDFEEDGQKYKGSSQVKIAPTMSDKEIISILEKGIFAATFVKNAYYPLAEKSAEKQPTIDSRFSDKNILPYMAGFRDSLYKNDIEEKGGVNSSEIFINKTKKRIVTSTGIDVSFDSYKGEIELVTDWNEGGEAVELYNMIQFSDYCPELIEEEAKIQIANSRDRALAKKTADLTSINVILGTEAVKDIMQFYFHRSNAKSIYEKISSAETGKVFQGENVTGDLVNITLNPFMKNSTASSPYDEDGIALKPVTLFEKGVLKQYHGGLQYASYLGIEATGSIENMEVKGGMLSYDSFKKEPYVEILNFSDFQMNPMTGDLGGEIRLAHYFDGEKTVPITAATLSANIMDIQKEFYLSRETTQKNSYIGPKALMFKKGHIAGA